MLLSSHGIHNEDEDVGEFDFFTKKKSIRNVDSVRGSLFIRIFRFPFVSCVRPPFH